MRLFITSLTKTAFLWYTSLPHGSVRDLDELEAKFHKQFYRVVPELSITDLVSYRQKADETVEGFLSRFKTARNQCFVMMSEAELRKSRLTAYITRPETTLRVVDIFPIYSIWGFGLLNMNKSGRIIKRSGQNGAADKTGES